MYRYAGSSSCCLLWSIDGGPEQRPHSINSQTGYLKKKKKKASKSGNPWNTLKEGQNRADMAHAAGGEFCGSDNKHLGSPMEYWSLGLFIFTAGGY